MKCLEKTEKFTPIIYIRSKFINMWHWNVLLCGKTLEYIRRIVKTDSE